MDWTFCKAKGRLRGAAVDEPAVKEFCNLLTQVVASGALLC